MVAVLSPYWFCDTTLAAIASAETIATIGHPCDIFSVGAPSARLHPYWDNRIQPLSAFLPSECVVHFSPNRLGPDSHHPYARHILATWTRPPFPRPYASQSYAVLAAPSEAQARLLEPVVTTDARWYGPWADSAALRTRDGRRGGGEIRLLVLVSSAKPARRAAAIANMLADLTARTGASIRLFCPTPWCGRAGNRLRDACRQSKGRLSYVRSQEFSEYWAALEWCDWFTDLSLRPGFGSFTASAVARGAIPLCYPMAPFDEWFDAAQIAGGLYDVLPQMDGSELGGVADAWLERLTAVNCLLEAQETATQGRFASVMQLGFQEFWRSALEETD